MEPVITINGKSLTKGQAMTVRCALENFAADLSEKGLGDGDTGKAICAGYLGNIREIRKLIIQDPVYKTWADMKTEAMNIKKDTTFTADEVIMKLREYAAAMEGK